MLNLDPMYLRQPRDDKYSVFPLPPSIRVERDRKVRVRDGIELSVNVFRPLSDESCPVIVGCTRYGKDASPADYLPRYSEVRRAVGCGFGDVVVSDATPFEAPDPAFWVANGYAVIHADARGTGRSGGQSRNSYSTEVIEDFCEVIEWAAQQGWSNGAVGMAGVSYLAIVQYLVAAKAPKGLKAICPWEGHSDRYREIAYFGGIPETGFIPWIADTSMTTIPGSDDEPEFGAPNSPLIQSTDLMRADLRAIRVPMLSCASWSDQGLHTVGSLKAFTEASTQDKWLFTHGREKWGVFHSDQANQYQLKFFDRFLKGHADAMANVPKVRLELRQTLNEYVVRDESAWPLENLVPTRLFLDASRARLTTSPAAALSSVPYESTANQFIHFVFDCEAPIELTGPMKLMLFMSASEGEDIDVFAGIRKFDASEQEVFFQARENDRRGIVAYGCLRASHRKIDAHRSTDLWPFLAHDEYMPVDPNEVYALEVPIMPASTLFEAGSKLVLTIGGRDVWSNRLCQHRSLRNEGRHTVYTGSNRASYLLVPMVRHM